jgi:hypothetical protein
VSVLNVCTYLFLTETYTLALTIAFLEFLVSIKVISSEGITIG